LSLEKAIVLSIVYVYKNVSFKRIIAQLKTNQIIWKSTTDIAAATAATTTTTTTNNSNYNSIQFLFIYVQT
jgi:hypothetical protein